MSAASAMLALERRRSIAGTPVDWLTSRLGLEWRSTHAYSGIMTTPEDVLQFWFGHPDVEDTSYAARRRYWFGKHPDFDQAIRSQFLDLHQQAIAGHCRDWETTPQSCLALIVVLDQFSRNMFRDTPQAFAADPQALGLAKQAIAQGFDQALPPLQRMFMYLPLEHSERWTDQRQSVELYEQLVQDLPELADVLDYAIRHQAVIERFGRFPHRNAILGRPSTPDEIEFLKQPGSSF